MTNKHVTLAIAALALVGGGLLLTGQPGHAPPGSGAAAPPAQIAPLTPSSSGTPPTAATPPLLPSPVLTPGVADPRFTVKDVCTPGFTATVRNVPESVKNAVYAEYGITTRKPGEYEIDHIISLELGGSNDIHNLWPQSYVTQPYNAHRKDFLENKLHALICAGKLDMPTAQKEISTDWIAAYHEYVGPL